MIDFLRYQICGFIFSVSAIALGYLAISFIQWEWAALNPSDWPVVTRLLASILVIFFFFTAMDAWKDRRND